MRGLPSRCLRVGVLTIVVAALVATPAAPAAADPLPDPSPDYETEALEACPDGDLPCVRQTLKTMEQHTRELVRSCDHNAVFALLYTIVTQFYVDAVAEDPDFFGDTAFVNTEDAAFAHYYFWPYVNWRDGLDRGVPPAWEVAFDAGEDEAVSSAGNLLLGINAHVVRDLPFVLSGLGMGDKRDHDRVNDILREAYHPAIQAINDNLDDTVDDANVDGVQLDDEALFRIVTTWRETAWQDARLLANAITNVDRAVVAREIEEKARLQAVSLRAEFAYPAVTDQKEQRNRYCAENASPGGWSPTE